MSDEKKRVELPTLREIDAELEDLAARRKWLATVRKLVAKLEPEAEGS